MEAEYAADLAWLNGGVRGKGWGVDDRKEQETPDAVVGRKRASGPIRTATRSTPPVAYTSPPTTTPSSSAAVEFGKRPAAANSAVPAIEPAEFLSLIKTDPTRAFQLIFPEYDVEDNGQRSDSITHTTSAVRGRRVEEETEEAAKAQPASPTPLTPSSPGWKYHHTAAFDVQRPDTAERMQRTDEVKEQVSGDKIHSDDHREEVDDQMEDEEAQPHSADAWTRDAVQRIVSHATQLWDEPTPPPHNAEDDDEEQDVKADESTADRAQHSDGSTYCEDEIDEEHWSAGDDNDEDNAELSAIETVTVSPPSPLSSSRHVSSRTPPVFSQKRPSPVSTHFLRPEQPVVPAFSLSSHSDSSTSATSAIDESVSSQHTVSPFTIAPSSPVSPLVSASDRDGSMNGSGRQQSQEDEQSLFEL